MDIAVTNFAWQMRFEPVFWENLVLSMAVWALLSALFSPIRKARMRSVGSKSESEYPFRQASQFGALTASAVTVLLTLVVFLLGGVAPFGDFLFSVVTGFLSLYVLFGYFAYVCLRTFWPASQSGSASNH
jgi:hypothetical protein